ncbi:hypothetical protein [Hydrogenophaga defluvii]|uniref:Uncharacterized protein n=1 Tax=Hydrogenophaga defluvii TaxID=249410 RepID=A0ABW2S9I8_9BURK
MTINLSDIKLLESERMSDAANGGGRRTSRVIVDGEPGNIFPKIGRVGGVYGRVNLRKVFGAVVTANLDVYADAHAIITDAPDDPKIHNNLFSTGSDYDTRTAARDRIESYVVAGPESRMVLYGRQLVGQQAVLVYQRVEEPLPEVGEVYCLSKEVGSVTNYQQFVRVGDITHEVRTFTDASGEFQRRLITLEIGAPLRYEFRGPDTPSRTTSVARESLVRGTTVADASRYFGIRPLAEAADEDDLTIRVDSVYSPIVPTTQRESPISLASIGGAGGYVLTAPSGFSVGSSFLGGFGGSYYFSRGIKPGTLVVSKGATVMATDDGSGLVVPTAAGAASGFDYAGAVDYASGAVTGLVTFVSDSIGFSALPATEVSQPARTKEIEITLGNRGTVYSEVLNPLPNPGSVIVDYRALGKWYRLRDDGTGAVSGNDPTYGTGTVDYVTGALVFTLGALPDVESSIPISWGSTVDYVIRAGATQDTGSATSFRQSLTLTHLPIEPSSLELQFISGGTAYTATANGSGVFSGNGVTGTVDHSTGAVEITYTTRKPDVASIVTADYNQQLEDNPAAPVNVANEVFDIELDVPKSLGFAPVRTGSFRMRLPATATTDYGLVSGQVQVFDDGFGQIKTTANHFGASPAGGVSFYTKSNVVVGTIDYATGVVELTTLDVTVGGQYYTVENGISIVGWQTAEYPAAINDTLTGEAFYVNTGGSSVQTARTDEFSTADDPIFVDLTATVAQPIVPGSVLFTLTGNSSAQFFDRNGVLYTALNPANGSATVAGSIDYETGRAYLTNGHNVGMVGSTPVSIAVNACLTQIGQFTTVDAFFRTAGSPLRPGSLYIQATTIDGALLSATADANGVISGTKVRGEVVQDMGVVRVEFGEVVAGEWVPTPVFPNTLRYSAVVLSNLPLNADILGLDPVRLPSDGRVPIYRPADVVVIHHTDSEELTNPVGAGASYGVGRTDLAELWLIDADGERVPTTKYTVNLAAGSVTMAADLDLTGYTQPLTARHRIEEMQLLSDVQINGTLGLTAALSREFPMGSLVSSALLFGDMQASVPVLFDLATFTTWSDTPGSGATAQYNDVDYPIEVLNNGAQTDRWRIHFLTGNPSSGTANFQVISENLGVIATGNTGTDCAPVNLLTGEPYFVIRADGWGLGWSVGNQLRFNTQAAAAPIWVARTVLPGATLAGDSVSISLRGDADA